MENYEKEPSHIDHLVDSSPFEDPQNFHIEVPKNKSVKTMANRALQNFGPGKPVVLYAQGRAISNSVSCVEIMKTYYKKPVYQCTRLGQIRTIETWMPAAGGLDPLKVTRSVPMIYILMSLEPLDDKATGYQKSINRRREEKRVLMMSELASVLPEDPPLSPSPKDKTL